MKPVLFLDSGVGGISYCRYFQERNPGESIVYLADRLHFPYGKWEKTELAAILINLMERIIKTVNPEIAVLACNTASIAALPALRECFPALPFVGTVPAVKPAAIASKNKKIGVLGTKLTIEEMDAEESYIRKIAAEYGNNEIMGIAAPELVEFIENNFDSATTETKKEIVQNYLNRFRAAGVDALVLGCTHFLFLLEEFRQEAAPDIIVFESIQGISLRIESLLAETGQPQEKVSGVQNRLLLTGSSAPEPSWTTWAYRLGFELSLLEAL